MEPVVRREQGDSFQGDNMKTFTNEQKEPSLKITMLVRTQDWQ